MCKTCESIQPNFRGKIICGNLTYKNCENVSDYKENNKIKQLEFENCKNLKSIQNIVSLSSLYIVDSPLLEKLKNLNSLTDLTLRYSNQIRKLKKLPKLNNIELVGLTNLKEISLNVRTLSEISIRDCPNLRKINLPDKTTIDFLCLEGCNNVKFSRKVAVYNLKLINCSLIDDININLSSVKYLTLNNTEYFDLDSFPKLTGVSLQNIKIETNLILPQIEYLTLENCEIEELNIRIQYARSISIENCRNLKKIKIENNDEFQPEVYLNFINCQVLKEVNLNVECECNLYNLPNLTVVTNKNETNVMNIRECNNLMGIPKVQKSYLIHNCFWLEEDLTKRRKKRFMIYTYLINKIEKLEMSKNLFDYNLLLLILDYELKETIIETERFEEENDYYEEENEIY
jgi:hypothetical protein